MHEGTNSFIRETERLLIRPLALDDLPALTAILSDPEVMRHSVRGVCDEAATREFIERCSSCHASCGLAQWALIDKRNSELIGFCGISPETVGNAEEMELGYRLAKRFWAKGLASESARAVLDYAFSQKRLGSVVVIIEPDHIERAVPRPNPPDSGRGTDPGLSIETRP